MLGLPHDTRVITFCVILIEASNASARKDLGQLRVSEAGTVFEIAKRPLFR